MELALLIWAAETIPSFFTTLGAFAFIILVASVAYLVLNITGATDPSYYDSDETKARSKDKHSALKKVAIKGLICSISIMLITSIIPHKSSTIYLMAGAYGTQKAVTSETGQRIIKMIENKVAEELDKLEKKDGK